MNMICGRQPRVSMKFLVYIITPGPIRTGYIIIPFHLFVCADAHSVYNRNIFGGRRSLRCPIRIKEE
jgi:hypothetical protein